MNLNCFWCTINGYSENPKNHKFGQFGIFGTFLFKKHGKPQNFNQPLFFAHPAPKDAPFGQKAIFEGFPSFSLKYASFFF